MTVTYNTESHQAVFDFVVEKIVGQGGPSFGHGGVCVYRAENGRKCAFGWLISDEEYHPSMECKVLQVKTGTIGMGAGFSLEVPEKNRKLIRELQLAHDACDSHSHKTGEDPTWKADCLRFDLKKVADRFDLDSSVVDRMLPQA